MTKLEVDSVDAVILKDLLGDARKSFTDIAKKLNISSTAVRNRYLNLKKMGVITGSTILLNPRALGFNCFGFLGLKVGPNWIKDVKDFLSKQQGILVVWDKVQTINIASYFALPSLEDFAKLTEELKKNPHIKDTQPLIYLGSPNNQHPDKLIITSDMAKKEKKSAKQEVVNPIQERTKEKSIKLDDIDYEITAILSRNARSSFNRIAQKLSISTVQVINRYEKMITRGVILNSSITVNSEKIGYSANAMIYINLEIGSNVHKILKKINEFPNVIILVRVMGEFDILTVIALRGFSELFKIEKQFRTMKGIRKVQINVNPPFFQWPINFFANLFQVEQ